MSSELLWLLLTLALVVGEVLTPTFFLGAIALAALVAAGVAWAGGGLVLQVAAFALGSIAFAAAARPFALRFLHSATSLPTNVAALIGAEARVVEAIGPESLGRVKVRGDDWRAVSEDGLPIDPGTRVLVTEVEGTTLHVVRHP